MHRIPGLSFALFLLIVVLCLALFRALVQGWSTAAVVALAVALVAVICILMAASVRGGIQYLRHARPRTLPDPRKAVGRLVKSLTSEDRRKAKQAARLLGEITSAEPSPGLGPFATEAGPAWKRWNDWWMANRAGARPDR
jgi:hypothetical protein